MKLFVVGFPKSGTTTLTMALRESGLKVIHWRDTDRVFAGAKIYRAVIAGQDPFANLAAYDAVTQADVCLPALGINFWPNLDFAVLRAIRRAHPACLFVLNYRRPEAIVDSIERWSDLQQRLTEADIPGLPRLAGGKREHLLNWIGNHYQACRHFFADDPHFLELDIESDDAPLRLGQALGIEIKGWGHYRPSETDPDAAELAGPGGS